MEFNEHQKKVAITFMGIFIFSITASLLFDNYKPYLILILESKLLLNILYVYLFATLVVHMIFCTFLNKVESKEMVINSSVGYYFDYLLNWATLLAIGSTGLNLLKGVLLQIFTEGQKVYFPLFSKVDTYVILVVAMILFFLSITKSFNLLKEAFIMKDAVEPEIVME